MKNIKLIIEFDGTHYNGWQRQKKQISIQKVLEDKISSMTQEDVMINGAGRTDAGVHAIGQVANFKTNSNIPIDRIPEVLNNLLPDDIRIKRAEKVNNDFHARHCAISKLYFYNVFVGSKKRLYPSILLNKYVHYVYNDLNLYKMREAGKLLIGEHDFSSFACSGSSFRSSIRTINRLVVKKNGNLIRFEIEANAFLYKMVRSIVGTLLEMGYSRMNYLNMKNILKERNRSKAGITIPAKGLFLMQVKYK